jgi:hypothetical protein
MCFARRSQPGRQLQDWWRCFLFILVASGILRSPVKSQVKGDGVYILYNCLVGGITGSLGSLINRDGHTSWKKAVFRGFAGGIAGGTLMYSGKRMTALVAERRSLLWAYPARMVFSAGNSMVENAASARPLFSRWHYDLGFLRMEYSVTDGSFSPKVMPSFLAGYLISATLGVPDLRNSLKSGTFYFRTHKIPVPGLLTAVNFGNSILVLDSMNTGRYFHLVSAHELVHSFQFQEWSGVNSFFIPASSSLRARSPLFAKAAPWIYFDLNYELMLVNYFLVNQGFRDHGYCNNFLENEAEFLSTRRSACN